MSKKIWNKIFKSKSPKNLKSSAITGNNIHKRCSIYEEYQQLNAIENFEKQEEQQPKLKIYECEKIITKTPTNDELPLPAMVAAASAPTSIAPQKTQSTFSKVVNSLTLKRNSKDASKDSNSSISNSSSNSTSYNQTNAGNKLATTNQSNKNTNNTQSSNNNSIIATSDDPDSNISLQLTPCPICSRTFNPVTLQKHVAICEKMATKKRNIFDSSRQRREGTELASYPLPKNYGLPPVKHDRGQSPKPMQISSPILTRKKPVDELARTTVRTSVRKHTNTTPNIAQAAATGAHTMTTPGAALTSNFNRDRMRSSERSLSKRIQAPVAEQCPYCERCFGVKAYDRHVEWCKEKALQASIKLTTKNEQNVAKERLEARTKYRAPCLKTKRSINRDKYAGLTGDENDSVDSPKSGNSTYNNNNNISSNNIMSLSLTSSIMSETPITNHGTSNGAYNSRNNSSNKTNASNNHSNNNNKNTACHAEQTLSMPTHPNKKDNLIRRSTEREVQDFRLNGEHCETPGDKRKKDALAIEHDDDFNNVAVNEVSVVASRRITLASRASINDSQDNQIEIHTSDGNDLLTTFATTTKPTAPLLLTKSLTSLSRRKLKTKEHSATNLSIKKQGLVLEDVSSAAVSAKIVNSNEPKGKELQSSISLPHLQQQQQQQEKSILELPRYTKLKTTMSTTALSVHTKLEINPIKGPIICRPKRKKLQRQQNATSAPLKAIPLLKESIETFGMSAHNKALVDKDKEIKIIKAPPALGSLKTPPTLVRNKSFILSGHLDGYDPFLSAKRQLEDLCSPSTSSSPQRTFNSNPQTPKTPKTPNTPNSPSTPCASLATQANRMTSSLMSSSQHSSFTQNGQGPLTNLAPKSNFRRTSSLRGPRRSPMLSSRPIFTQKQRPTIQRGLSDEGPISTNFLKPEEYDEMPVRAVCVNDFALTNSPRVLRRDTSSSNRKHNLKLNVSAANSTQVSPSINPESEEGMPSTSKYVSKTDSLAVFLKYENEMEKLPATGMPSILSESPVITKELKDKSNILSKQNSAKNIISEAQDSLKRAEAQQNSSNWLPDPIENHHHVEKSLTSSQSNNENHNSSNKFNQLRLEPISKEVTKPPTPQSKPTTPLYKSATPIFSKKSVLPTSNAPIAMQPIKLTSIFGDSKSKESKGHDSSNMEFIDPKLINKCDNLPVSVTAGRTTKHPDLVCSVQRSECSSSSSESSKVPASTSKSSKVLAPHFNVETHKSASISQQTKSDQPIASPSQRNSSDGRNLLKRKMRLGRNQFLYDESPDTDCCSADDEANRSSVEYDDRNFPANNLRNTHFLYQQPNMSAPIAPPTIPPLPIFDDFDFEEFLSSFQNDDDQFPLFKDCREFLMNRTSNKQRSTVTSNSDFTRNNNNKHTNPHAQTSKQSPTYNPTTSLHFPYESLNNRQYTDPLLTTSSYRAKSNLDSMESNHNATFTNYDDLKSARSTEYFDGVDQKKREIFISIETEQNDQGRSTISPDSLRSIVGGNQKPHVEEVPANDNKFSKIEDDDDRMPNSPTSQSFFEASQLPNIQLNNAKNLIQKMQDSFRQMGEEAGANLRQAVINSTPRSTTTSNSFCENSRSPLTTERSGVAGNVDGAAEADSDDASSLESYPVSSQSSRRGVASKLSADSAYGSLSRQRSSEFANLNRNQIQSRPSTSNCGTNTAMTAPMIDAATQHQHQQQQQQQQQQQKPEQQQQYYKGTTTRNRSRQFSAESSTSGSDISLPPSVANSINHCSNSYLEQQLMTNPSNQNRFEQQQHQQQQQIYDNSFNNNTYLESPLNSPTTPSSAAAAEEASAPASASLGASTPASCSSSSINNSSMTSSMKMSRFCHECGTRFLIEQAKFCMDCGVKRIVL